jgi:hypothetical protein
MKKVFLLSMIASLTLLTGCSRDEEGIANNGNAINFDAMPAKTRVATTTLSTLTSFTVAANSSAYPTATDFSHFRDINVLRKAGTNDWDYSPKQYWPGGTTTVDFYAFSPAGSPNLKGFTNISTADATTAVIDYVVPFATKPAVAGVSVAETQEDLLVARALGKSSSAVQLDFVHALSRVNFSAVNQNSADMTIYIDKVELTDLASRGTLALGAFDTSAPSSLDVWNNPTAKGDYYIDFVSGGIPVYGSGGAMTLYPLNTPEQGLMVLPQIVDKTANTTVKVIYHIRNGAGQSSISQTAIFDLSKDENFEFNINTQYHFQFAFTAQGGITFSADVQDYWDDIDVPLDPVAVLPSNTYIVKPGSFSISIPVYSGDPSGGGETDPTSVDYGQVSRAIYAAPAGANLATTWLDNTKLKVGILWTDVDPDDYTVVKALKLTGTVAGNDLRITVTPGADIGNALVILYDDKATEGAYKEGEDEIKWSWLIWNVDYTPTGTWMDRNLGAITNDAAGQSNSYGFMYQWGRKDPLQHADNNGDLAQWYAYDNGAAVLNDGPVVAVAATTSVTDWVNTPTTFYTADGTYGDYSGLGTINDNLWNPATKTVYDPCPTGWIVPQRFDNLGFSSDTSGLIWNTGYTFSGKGEYYPLTGLRDEYGDIASSGLESYNWASSTDGGVDVYFFYTFSGTVIPDWSNPRVYGRSVRCIRE